MEAWVVAVNRWIRGNEVSHGSITQILYPHDGICPKEYIKSICFHIMKKATADGCEEEWCVDTLLAPPSSNSFSWFPRDSVGIQTVIVEV